MYHTRVLFLATIMAMVISISSYAQDKVNPMPVTTDVIQQYRVDHDGTEFTFNTVLAGSVSVADYAASEGDVQIPSPAYTEFTFGDYVAGDYQNYAPMPRIDIFTIENFGPYPYFIEQLDALSQLLAERPDLNQHIGVDPSNFGANALPFLPIFPAAQVFRAQPEYINVANIEGIRYLVYYSQSMNPIVEGEVFYTFQGITEDGQHYVSVILPVNTQALPTEMPAIEDYDAYAADYQTYLVNMIGTLTNADPENFIPAMSTMDTLTQSIRISR